MFAEYFFKQLLLVKHFWRRRKVIQCWIRIFTVSTWWLPSACEWVRWRAGWSPPRSRWTGSSWWSLSEWRSPVANIITFSPRLFHLSLGRWERRGVACQGVQHCLLAALPCLALPSPFIFPLLLYHGTLAVCFCYQSLLLGGAQSQLAINIRGENCPTCKWKQVAWVWFPSSLHAPTCSWHLMRNWTGPWSPELSYPPSLPALIPNDIVRSAPRMY